jgi:hypothetical protein
MKTLQAGSTIGGAAGTSSVINCTIYGLEKKGADNTYKILYQGQLSSGTIYTVPADTIAMIREIDLVNTSASQVTGIQLTVDSDAITPPFVLEADGFAHYGTEGWKFYDKYGYLLTKRAEVNVLVGTSATPPSATGLPDNTRYYQYLP